MSSKKILISSLALALTIGTVSLGNTQTLRRHQPTTNFSTEQQQTIQSLEAKAQQQLTAKENALRAKGAELDRALANDATTIATVNNLRNELAALEQDYWQLRDQVNAEISATIGTGYYGYGGWGPYNCRWHNGHNYARGYMAQSNYGPMMGRGGYGNGWYCNW